ncbi:MAG: DNA adenine methylase, partial [Chryseobacterium sp.]
SILATISPSLGYASDIYEPLVAIWQNLKIDPEIVVEWYAQRVSRLEKEDKKIVYEDIKARFNASPNGPDFLFLTRTCWGGVIRFRKADNYMSTPVGYHDPINLDRFRKRAYEWHERIKDTIFRCEDYTEAFKRAQRGDFIYCDPPYKNSQTILYGSQKFDSNELFDCILKAKNRGVFVAMSFDGHSKSGVAQSSLQLPDGIFERVIDINDRFSMLLRFKKLGQKLTNERDTEKLYLTY